VSQKVQCASHGERDATFLCSHLAEQNSVALGFNTSGPSSENPFPDAWCDDCEVICTAHGGWNQESEKLLRVVLLCSGCYLKARIRNTKPDVTLDDLADLRWKCSHCEEWHNGPCLDFSYSKPAHWPAQNSGSPPDPETFLNDDFCAIKGQQFFVRGIIPLSIIGTADSFAWGVWGSLSKENFERLIAIGKEPKRTEFPPMFSWLSNQIREYPDTLDLKMRAHIQPPKLRPRFELELTDHPLAQEYHYGIAPQRVKEMMLGRLRFPQQ
jgi:hypothetical protein